jgi:ribonuclease D
VGERPVRQKLGYNNRVSVKKLPKPILITRQEALKDLVELLNRQAIIAVDTESNSLHAYQEQVCLIQFSTMQSDYLVDPLLLEDLSPLRPVFENGSIEKVFHAAEYDVYCLKRDFDFEFRNLFDTMLAARILGREGVGLGTLLEEEFDVHLEKRYQRANWGQRPLPSYLLAYARMDTHYLIELRNRLRAALLQAGLWSLASEDFRRLTELSSNGKTNEDPTAGCWRVSGAYDLSPQKVAVLVELCRYRDKVARNIDRPLFKVISDSTLLAIAERVPHDLEALGQLPGMSRRQLERHGKALLAVVQRGLDADPVYPPRSPRPSEAFLGRVEALRRWRKDTAEQMGVKSDVILPRDLMNAIAEQNPRGIEDLETVLEEVPWRLKNFGGQIMKVLGEAGNGRRN